MTFIAMTEWPLQQQRSFLAKKEGVERERQEIAIGEIVRQARAALGWSQKELSRRVCAQSYIAWIEDPHNSRQTGKATASSAHDHFGIPDRPSQR